MPLLLSGGPTEETATFPTPQNMTTLQKQNALALCEYLENHVPASRYGGDTVIIEAIRNMVRFDSTVVKFPRIGNMYYNPYLQEAMTSCREYWDFLKCQTRLWISHMPELAKSGLPFPS